MKEQIVKILWSLAVKISKNGIWNCLKRMFKTSRMLPIEFSATFVVQKIGGTGGGGVWKGVVGLLFISFNYFSAMQKNVCSKHDGGVAF